MSLKKELFIALFLQISMAGATSDNPLKDIVESTTTLAKIKNQSDILSIKKELDQAKDGISYSLNAEHTTEVPIYMGGEFISYNTIYNTTRIEGVASRKILDFVEQDSKRNIYKINNLILSKKEYLEKIDVMLLLKIDILEIEGLESKIVILRELIKNLKVFNKVIYSKYKAGIRAKQDFELMNDELKETERERDDLVVKLNNLYRTVEYKYEINRYKLLKAIEFYKSSKIVELSETKEPNVHKEEYYKLMNELSEESIALEEAKSLPKFRTEVKTTVEQTNSEIDYTVSGKIYFKYNIYDGGQTFLEKEKIRLEKEKNSITQFEEEVTRKGELANNKTSYYELGKRIKWIEEKLIENEESIKQYKQKMIYVRGTYIDLQNLYIARKEIRYKLIDEKRELQLIKEKIASLEGVY